MHCKAGCVYYGEDGIGFPCENIDPEGRFFSGCSKPFYNDNCFQRHASNNSYQQFYLDCGVIWNVRNMYRRKRKGHECGARFCIAFHNYHIERKCYIQQCDNCGGYRICGDYVTCNRVIVVVNIEQKLGLRLNLSNTNRLSYENSFVIYRFYSMVIEFGRSNWWLRSWPTFKTNNVFVLLLRFFC